jgi:hypothetical protein
MLRLGVPRRSIHSLPRIDKPSSDRPVSVPNARRPQSDLRCRWQTFWVLVGVLGYGAMQYATDTRQWTGETCSGVVTRSPTRECYYPWLSCAHPRIRRSPDGRLLELRPAEKRSTQPLKLVERRGRLTIQQETARRSPTAVRAAGKVLPNQGSSLDPVAGLLATGSVRPESAQGRVSGLGTPRKWLEIGNRYLATVTRSSPCVDPRCRAGGQSGGQFRGEVPRRTAGYMASSSTEDRFDADQVCVPSSSVSR